MMLCFKNLTFSRTSRRLLGEIQLHVSKTLSNGVSSCKSKLQVDELVLTKSKTKFEIKKWTVSSTHNQMRTLSTVQPSSIFSIDDRTEFMAFFSDITRELTEDRRYSEVPESMERFRKALQYNLTKGKLNRGLTAVTTYKTLEKPENLTPENIRLANILGWCVELSLAYYLILDDIIDNSELRRGQPCWYKNEEVGMTAINDAILLMEGMFSILRTHFSNLQCYAPIIELFHDTLYKCALGQALDCHCLQDGKPTLDKFTMERYKTIGKYKTSYLHAISVKLGMYLSNMYDQEQHRQVETLMMDIGEFFQIQDDFIDVFGDPNETGKIGTDIKDGKCSWLAVVALQRATAAQRKVMEAHYGRSDDKSIQMIKNLYEELDLRTAFAIYEEETYNIIKSHIHEISGLSHNLFLEILNKIYKRNR